MKAFTPVYIPAGVPTFHLESAKEQLEASKVLLRGIDGRFAVPDDMLLSIDALNAFLDTVQPDLVVFQNLTFANSAYISAVRHRVKCPILLWTLREPVIDGGRLRLNSLTGAYSAANAMRAFGDRRFEYVFGAPNEERVRGEITACVKAAELIVNMRSLKMSAVGHTPQGFGFGRALDAELLSVFGVQLDAVEARELISRAESYTADNCAQYLTRSEKLMRGLENTPEKNRLDYARLLRAYDEYVRENGIGALASRCWPDFFTAYGTPVCAVLSVLNDLGIAAACEADIYGALSMWMGMQLSGEPVFFGDPVSLNEDENTLTFWHCGAAACALARRDTGAAVGVHPNRRIGPAMDFGCEAFPEATVFRVGREPDGSFRFFVLEGEALDKPKQFTGTSIVVKTGAPVREIVEKSVRAGFEPHYAVIKGHHASTLTAAANMLGIPVYRY